MLPAPSSMRHVPIGLQHHGSCTHALPQAHFWQRELPQIAIKHMSDNSPHEMQSAQQQHALCRQHSPSGFVGQQGVKQPRVKHPGLFFGTPAFCSAMQATGAQKHMLSGVVPQGIRSGEKQGIGPTQAWAAQLLTFVRMEAGSGR